MKRQQNYLVAAVGFVCLFFAASCGDGGSPTSPTVPPTPAPVSTVISEGNFQIGTIVTSVQIGDPCDFIELIDFETSASGTLEAIVDWTFERNDLDIAIMSGRCTCALVAANACITVVESLSATAKPERISATNQSAGTYTLMVANFDDEPESGSYQVILTS